MNSLTHGITTVRDVSSKQEVERKGILFALVAFLVFLFLVQVVYISFARSISPVAKWVAVQNHE